MFQVLLTFCTWLIIIWFILLIVRPQMFDQRDDGKIVTPIFLPIYLRLCSWYFDRLMLVYRRKHWTQLWILGIKFKHCASKRYLCEEGIRRTSSKKTFCFGLFLLIYWKFNRIFEVVYELVEIKLPICMWRRCRNPFRI